jgi:hypothetical protein
MATNTAKPYTNLLKDGQLDPIKHDVRLLIERHPECKVLGGARHRTSIEMDICELLDSGYILANFTTAVDSDGSPVCSALMIKVPQQ